MIWPLLLRVVRTPPASVASEATPMLPCASSPAVVSASEPSPSSTTRLATTIPPVVPFVPSVFSALAMSESASTDQLLFTAFTAAAATFSLVTRAASELLW